MPAAPTARVPRSNCASSDPDGGLGVFEEGRLLLYLVVDANMCFVPGTWPIDRAVDLSMHWRSLSPRKAHTIEY